ncbi:hypothetical protein CBA19CS22_13165 [Caballeronia novacaledonica]|uniref:Uncharacterized protein n=1 Tax=Caballeronia novacaledonica TaxID=1544861 RepID=A0ACB5QS22_9BURK|nr:hypothetical protein CBA19CS22_13165 [Caballeronia novacaledonica]
MVALLFLVGSVCAQAAPCSEAHRVRVVGDAPAAISYDIFMASRPVDAQQLASFIAAQQVRMLADGTIGCVLADDGVTDPTALLIQVPNEPVNYWVRSWNVETVGAAK